MTFKLHKLLLSHVILFNTPLQHRYAEIQSGHSWLSGHLVERVGNLANKSILYSRFAKIYINIIYNVFVSCGKSD